MSFEDHKNTNKTMQRINTLHRVMWGRQLWNCCSANDDNHQRSLIAYSASIVCWEYSASPAVGCLCCFSFSQFMAKMNYVAVPRKILKRIINKYFTWVCCGPVKRPNTHTETGAHTQTKSLTSRLVCLPRAVSHQAEPLDAAEAQENPKTARITCKNPLLRFG